MPSHIMLSYQWDDQALVKKIYDRLKEDGLPVWMDIEGGVTGNINDAMAAGVEEAAVICPFMTPAYQASRSCKKELNYADGRGVAVVPVMLADDWEASEWLGLITAGLLWVDFRNAEKDEERFDVCLGSLEEEIAFNGGHLLVEERRADEPQAPAGRSPKRKKGRGFRHARSGLYIHDLDVDVQSDSRHRVQLREAPGEQCFWEEIKGGGCKLYRNVVTKRFLGLDSGGDEVHSEVSPSASEEWLLLVDRTDHGPLRAVVLKNKRSGRLLAVRNGRFEGLASYSEDCRWFLE